MVVINLPEPKAGIVFRFISVGMYNCEVLVGSVVPAIKRAFHDRHYGRVLVHGRRVFLENLFLVDRRNDLG
jgi:hypothetical protein